MNELIRAYLVHKESSDGRTVATVDKYGRYLRILERWLAPTPIEQASAEQLVEFTGPYAHRELRLSPMARRPLISAIKGFYAWLVETGVIPESPAARITHPKAGRRLPVPMQLANAEKLLMQPDMSTFIGVRDAAILSVLIGCGPRISGVARLNESDLIWTRDDQGAPALVIRFTEKGNKQRLVPAPPDAMWMLRAYLGHDDLRAIDRTLPNGDRVLFVSTMNRKTPECDYIGEARRISPRSIDEMIKRYGEKAGIPQEQLHAHALRHLFGAELEEDDVDLLVRQALMGHASPETTKIYSHIATRKLARAMRRASPLSKIRTPVRGIAEALGDAEK